MSRNKLLLVAGLALLIAACGDTGTGLEVDNARIGQPAGPNAALYLTATSNGQADRLLGATTAVADAVELHQTTIDDDGTMSMNSVGSLDLPADGEIVLEPGGYHLMLVDAERLDVGDMVDVTLEWENDGEMTIQAEVVDPGDVMGDDA